MGLSGNKPAPSFLEQIGYEEEKTLEERKKERGPDFSVPETLTGFTKTALLKELVSSGVLEEEDVASGWKRLNVSGLNKVFRLCTGKDRCFEVRRNFFRELREEVDWIGSNELNSCGSFSREGLAKIVDRYCDVEKVEF